MKILDPFKSPPISRTACFRRSAGGLLFGSALALIVLPAGLGADDGEVVAVAAKVAPGYARTKQPDGSYAAETFTFGEGGNWSGPMKDLTIDKLQFLDVAKIIALPLVEQNFLPSQDVKKIKLLIMVYWGTTDGSGGVARADTTRRLAASQADLSKARADFKSVPDKDGHYIPRPANWGANWGKVNDSLFGANVNQDVLMARTEMEGAEAKFDSSMTVNNLANRERDRELVQNALLLGYESELEAVSRLEMTARQIRRQDLIDELEDNRYFVVLMAYDFQTVLKEKKHKLLWETRYSVRQRGIDFSKNLAAITEEAARYFGQDSHGVSRKRLPIEHVTLGEMKVKEIVPDKK